jgi:hypothetical protein
MARPSNYAGFHRGKGDETHNPVGTLEVLVPGEGTSTFARQIHVAQSTDGDTDWGIAAQSHPTLYLHSVTTPITDYLRVGGHDGTTAYVDVVGGTTLALQVAGATQMDITATVVNVLDGNIFYVGVEATAGTNAGTNYIGIEDGADDPTGTLTNSLALYTPDAGDSLDFLHADGSTDSLGT